MSKCWLIGTVIASPLIILGFGVWAIVTAGCDSAAHPCLLKKHPPHKGPWNPSPRAKPIIL
jgi:hypothetical protein